MRIKNLTRIVLVAVALLVVASSICVSAAADHTSTINLGNVRKNEAGVGYEWNNPDRILTLDGLEITTEDDFGLKLPDNCTVVLKGTSRIKASKYGIGVPGSVVFEGNGKLIVEGGVSAIYNYSYSENHKMRFSGGSYELSGESAIISDNAEISVTKGDLELTATGEMSVKGRIFNLNGGKIRAVGAIYTSHLLDVDRAEISVAADGAALVSGNHLKLENVKISAGDTKDSLKDTDEYAGESCIEAKPLAKKARVSILFGEGTPITVDYILLALAAVLLACGIALPYMHKKKKVRKLYERLDAEKAKEAENKKKK